MDREEVKQFFDRLAPTWDAEMIRNDAVINTILDCGGVAAGRRVLDVACGTGVLFSDYLARDVASVTAVDLSPEMVKIAAAKCTDSRIRVICADVQELAFAERFDCIMIYNAFPHFPEPEALLMHLAGALAPGGRLTVAHGMSRAKIDAHHHGSAARVSMGLMHEDALAAIMNRYLSADIVISDEEKYIVSGFLM